MGEREEVKRRVDQVRNRRALMGSRDGGQRSHGTQKLLTTHWRKKVATVQASHTVRNDVGFLSAIQQFTIETVIDLVTKLISPELDASRRIKLGYQNGKPLGSEMLSYFSKIFDAKFLAKPENSMNQDDIHDRRILAP